MVTQNHGGDKEDRVYGPDEALQTFQNDRQRSENIYVMQCVFKAGENRDLRYDCHKQV